MRCNDDADDGTGSAAVDEAHRDDGHHPDHEQVRGGEHADGRQGAAPIGAGSSAALRE